MPGEEEEALCCSLQERLVEAEEEEDSLASLLAVEAVPLWRASEAPVEAEDFSEAQVALSSVVEEAVEGLVRCL